MPEKTELDPCPFCGDALRMRYSMYPYITCNNPSCETGGLVCDTEAEAIIARNTRVGEGE